MHHTELCMGHGLLGADVGNSGVGVPRNRLNGLRGIRYAKTGPKTPAGGRGTRERPGGEPTCLI